MDKLPKNSPPELVQIHDEIETLAFDLNTLVMGEKTELDSIAISQLNQVLTSSQKAVVAIAKQVEARRPHQSSYTTH